MDFFGILFDMKNGKKVPYSKSYFDTLFAENLAGVTTLTGTLPLTFTTSETALHSWTIYGADIEHIETTSGKSTTFHTDEDKLRDWTIYGNNNIGKNLLDIESSTIPQHMTIDSVDNPTGSIVLTAESGYTYRGTSVVITNLLEIGKTYEITLTKNNATPSEQLANATLRRVDTNAIVVSAGSANFEAAGDKTFTYTHTQERAEQGIYFSLLVTGNSKTGGTLSVSNLMIREATTSATFEPYQIGVGQRTNNGYIVPLSVNGNTVNIPIGNAPLTEGQSVSKTSTGVDIATTDGNNAITTSLYNQPDMSITYNEFTGVGLFVGNMFIIALQLKAGGSTLNVFNITLNKPLRAGETLTSEQTGETIQTVAGVENKLTPSPKAASYGGNFDMTIKYKE